MNVISDDVSGIRAFATLERISLSIKLISDE
jgi:hypothetical protein